MAFELLGPLTGLLGALLGLSVAYFWDPFGKLRGSGGAESERAELWERFSGLKEDFRDLEHTVNEALADVEYEFEKIRAAESRIDRKAAELRKREERELEEAALEEREAVEAQIMENLEGEGPQNGGEGPVSGRVAAFLARRS